MKYKLRTHSAIGISALLLMIASLMLTGCVKVDTKKIYKKDGKRYGVTRGLFQGRWYHYYERGLSFAEGKIWQEAERDYRKAIQLRDGDQLRARTYGLHFIEYFPHRELGIAFYHQNLIEAAIKELEISLRTQATAKAEYYLDKARKKKIIALLVDKEAPQITITSPSRNHYTNLNRIYISGMVRDNTFVKSIQVNEQIVRIDLSAPQVMLDVEVPLQDSKNSITITAVDLIGNSSQVQRTVNVDRMGPVISLSPPGLDEKTVIGKTIIRGFVYDKTNLDHLMVNGQNIPISVAKEFKLEQHVTLLPKQLELVVEASDILGNETVARIQLNEKRAMMPRPLIASADVLMLADNAPHKPGTSKYVTLPPDMIKPNIKVDDWQDSQFVYLEEVYLAGHAQDNEWVDALMVNRLNILDRPGKTVFFNCLETLDVGPNLIKFKAWDPSGNQTELKVNFERQIQEIRDIGARMDMVIFPFLHKGSSDRFGTVVEERLLSELEKIKRFNITSSLSIDPKEIVDPNDVVRIARRMKASYILTGTIIETDDSIDIYANVVETTSTQIIRREDVYGEQLNRIKLKKLCRGLAIKLEYDFPLVEGKVFDIQGKTAHLKFTGSQNIVKGMRCILFAEQVTLDEQSKRVVDRRDIRLGAALITAVKKSSGRQTLCEAEIYETENEPIKRGHLVITQ
jgi:TolB-like protein